VYSADVHEDIRRLPAPEYRGIGLGVVRNWLAPVETGRTTVAILVGLRRLDQCRAQVGAPRKLTGHSHTPCTCVWSNVEGSWVRIKSTTDQNTRKQTRLYRTSNSVSGPRQLTT